MKKLLGTALAIALPVMAMANVYTFSDLSDGTNSTLSSLAHGTAYTWGFTNASLGGTSLSGLESAIHSGSQVITGATLTLTGIHDWTSESHDVLYVDILNGLSTGVHSTSYMPQVTNDTVYGDDPFNPNSKLVSYHNGIVSYNPAYGSYNTLLTNTPGHVAFQSAQTGATILASSATTTSSHYNPVGDPGTFTAVNTTASFTISYNLSTANLWLLGSFLSNDAVGGSTAGQDLGLGFGPDCHFYDSGIKLTVTTGSRVPESSETLGLLGLSLALLAALAGKSKRSTKN